MEWTSGLTSPARLRTWAAIGAVSAALQRRVHTRIRGQDQFANMYIMLVAPPGIGKGNALKHAMWLCREVDGIIITPQGITRRAFYSTMEAAATSNINIETQEHYRHCSMAGFIEEFGVFVKSGDLDFMYHLADVFDNPPQFHYKTEHAGENNIENACFTMLTACTPKGLKDILSDEALEMGFPARMVMVYSDEQIDVPLWDEPEHIPKLREDLVHDLHEIFRLKGVFTWTPAAKDYLQSWVTSGLKPFPADQRFEHYNTRRLTQVTKLAMIVSAGRHNDLVIDVEDIAASKDLLLDAESVMHNSISALGANPLLTQQKYALALVEKRWKDAKVGVAESSLIRLVSAEVHPQYLQAFIEMLAQGRWLDVVGNRPERVFYPRGMATSDKRVNTSAVNVPAVPQTSSDHATATVHQLSPPRKNE